MQPRAWLSRRLEQGAPGGPVARLASRVWAATVRVERPLRFPSGARVIAVGGPTLGGSGKTPLAIACTEFLHRSGVRVALVGHGYGGLPGRPRFVSPRDPVSEVGDEALECAARLSPQGIPVVVAETRQQALDLALADADVVVLDGPCQTRPRRASLSLLVVDMGAPWGAGSCPPEGDLRAPKAVLLAAADRVVGIGVGSFHSSLPFDRATIASGGAWLGGRLLDWNDLRSRRIGLLTAMARPERVEAMLESHGVRPAVAIHGADHRLSFSAPRSCGIELWLCTPKARTHMGSRPAYTCGAPVATLDFSLKFAGSLERALLEAASADRLTHAPPPHTLECGVA